MDARDLFQIRLLSCDLVLTVMLQAAAEHQSLGAAHRRVAGANLPRSARSALAAFASPGDL